MKIYAQDFFDKSEDNLTQRQDILPSEEEAVSSIRTKLESDYLSGDLGYGDRLRVSDPQGNLYDVIQMPDGSIAIQELTLKIEFGTTHKYNDWENASEALPKDYAIETPIKASKNPYI